MLKKPAGNLPLEMCLPCDLETYRKLQSSSSSTGNRFQDNTCPNPTMYKSDVSNAVFAYPDAIDHLEHLLEHTVTDADSCYTVII